MSGGRSGRAPGALRARGPGSGPVAAFPLLAAATLCVAAATACGGSGPASGWAGTVDTLPGGAVRVHSPATGTWDSASAWHATEVLRIGAASGGGPDMFSQVTAVTIDGRDRLWVLDRADRVVKVFDARGRFVRSVGGEGGGPGEFGDPIGLALGPAGQVWVCDPKNGRYAVFDISGAYLRGYRREIGGYRTPWPGRFTADGVLYDLAFLPSEGDAGFRGVLVGSRPDGGRLAPVDSVPLPPDPFTPKEQQFEFQTGDSRMMVGIPWSPSLKWWFARSGDLWFGRSDHYRILELGPGGDTLRVVERDWTPVAVTERDRQESGVMQFMRDHDFQADLSRIPDVKPAYRSFRTDGRGDLWVEASAPAETEATLVDVFGPDGRYRGALRLPAHFGLPRAAFRGDRLCGPAATEAGVPLVVCLRIDRPGSSG